MTVNSVAMLCPSAHRASLNALGEAMGYGPDNWNVPLSADGAQPATHWGTHIWERPGGPFNALRLAVQAGQTPQGLEAYEAALQSLIFRVVEGPENAQANWEAALSAAGLNPLSA